MHYALPDKPQHPETSAHRIVQVGVREPVTAWSTSFALASLDVFRRPAWTSHHTVVDFLAYEDVHECRDGSRSLRAFPIPPVVYQETPSAQTHEYNRSSLPTPRLEGSYSTRTPRGGKVSEVSIIHFHQNDTKSNSGRIK